MANDFVQTMIDARVDARSLSDFMFYPASEMVARRLAPSIHTLNYYLDYFNGLESLYSQESGTVTVNGVEIKTVRQAMNDAIDDVLLGEYQEGIRADLNAQKLDTGITATAKFGGVERSQASKNLDSLNTNDFLVPKDGIEDSTASFLLAVAAAQDAEQELIVSSGTYVLNSKVYINGVTLRCEPNVIFDFRNNSDSSCFISLGTIDSEVNITALSQSTRTATLSTAATYQKGDILLLKSKTRCDLASDAGDMVLGVGTAGSSPVYFAEPVEVLSCSGTTLVLGHSLVFDKYSTVKSGFVADVAKINFQTCNIYGYPRIVLSDSRHHSGVYANYLKDANIDVVVQASAQSSQAVRMGYSYKCNVNGTCYRPSDWVLVADHSFYNSWKTISGWYNKFNVVEHYGAQSVDQTFNGIPSIGEQFVVNAYNPQEQGFTSHGMSYGMIADVTVYNAALGGLYNRARFCKLKLRAYNNPQTKAGVNAGLVLSDYGMTDVEADIIVSGFVNGIRFTKSYNAVTVSPETMDVKITGTVTDCNDVLNFYSKAIDNVSYKSNFDISVNSQNCNNIVAATGSGWHNVILSGSHTMQKNDNGGTLINANVGYGWSLKNLRVTNYGANKKVVYVSSSGSATDPLAITIDWNSCTFLGDGVFQHGFNYIPTIFSAAAITTTSAKRLLETDVFYYAATAVENLVLTVDSPIPIGKRLTFYCKTHGFTVSAGTDAAIYGTTSGTHKVITIMRVGTLGYIVSGY